MRRTSLVSLNIHMATEQLYHLSIWGLLAVSSGYGCHPDEDFTCKFKHPHGHQYGDYWRLALVMDVNPDEDFR